MEVIKSLRDRSLILLFYNSINEYSDFVFGCYGISVDHEYNDLKKIDVTKTQLSDIETKNKQSVLQELENFKTRLNTQIQSIKQQSCKKIYMNYFDKRFEKLKTLNKSQNTVTYNKTKKTKNKISSDINLEPEQKKRKNHDIRNSSLESLFTIIDEKIDSKYYEEIKNKKYNIDKLINSNIFHKSSNIYYTKGKEYQINQERIRNIQNSIGQDIKRLNLNINKDITSCWHAIF